MTDSEIVEILTERLGYRIAFLTSKDAIAKVLEGFTEEEWRALHILLFDASLKDHEGVKKVDRYRAFFPTKWMLTLPPRQLSAAVAEVLQKEKK